MKIKIILFTLILYMYSCQNKTKSDNNNPSNNESTEKQFTCESNIDIDSHDEGQFIGEFLGLEDGMWGTLKFLDKERKTIWISLWGSNENLRKLNGSNYLIDPKNFTLLDSLYSFPEKFKGRLLRVGWSKFDIHKEEEPTSEEPILTHLNYPNVKFDGIKIYTNNESTKEVKSSEEVNRKNIYKIGEIRGMIYGTTLTQVEEEIGCIDYNFEGTNKTEDDNCPGKRLHVRKGMMCFGYNFVVYKNFVLNSKDEVSDLLVVVKDWGKTYSKVTYVGIFEGKLDPYEHCKE